MYITGYPSTESFKGPIIPQSFIRYEYGTAYVYKKIGDEFKKVYIKLGKCDDNFCIVKDGVTVGDVIK